MLFAERTMSLSHMINISLFKQNSLFSLANFGPFRVMQRHKEINFNCDESVFIISTKYSAKQWRSH